ncbi:GBF-interacting protein 1-like isoform X2 [Durio zibethinus]|uniref:GBF-interacting protein 1-like isoform X2 n=1 Tax=Durio zibethinus TaxID=66656 RepID=A0A6P5ZJN8_DURZI|nr:GBF-interacting protein 1-like isoform X2 [Durio zibethinus]
MSGKGGDGGGGGGGGGSGVSIPDNAKKTIQSIREITGKQHSDEEVYAVLKECSMDPNETAQKLLYLDTFHEVKRKRDKKKETAGTQGRGGRASQGNYYTLFSKDAGGGRNASARRENEANHTSDRGSMPLPRSHKVKNNAATNMAKTPSAIPNGTTALPNGSSSHGRGTQLSVDDVNGETKDGLPANKPTIVSVQPTVTEPLAPVPAQSIGSLIRGQEKSTSNLNASSTSATSATVSGVYSSASDPVVVPTVTQHAGAVGTITREIRPQQEAAEIKLIQGTKHVPRDIDASKTEKTASEVPSSMHENKAPSKSKIAEQVKQSKLMEPTTLQVVTTEVATVKANSQLLADPIVPNAQHVTFPTHFQVSEALKNGLTFGSFDANFGQEMKHDNVTSVEINSACTVEASQGSSEAAGEPSSRSQGTLSAVDGGNADGNADQPHSPPEFEKVLESDGNISSDADLKVDQSNQEMYLHPEGNQSVVPNASSYGFGFMPASASHLAQFDGPEARVHDVSHLTKFASGNSPAPSGSSTPPVQSSVAAAPQAVHLLRQSFPPNYFPYPHYLSPFYMHPMHQFLNPTGLTQQPSTGNVYMPPGAAAPGVKFPLPQFKPGTNAGNPSHLTIPSGYGALTSPPVGFNLSVSSVTSGSSSSKEDLAASQLKENHIFTTGPLAGHGAFAGLYQSAQTMAAPSNVNTLLQQSQAMGAAVETMASASGAYQQPQLAQINWNTNY